MLTLKEVLVGETSRQRRGGVKQRPYSEPRLFPMAVRQVNLLPPSSCSSRGGMVGTTACLPPWWLRFWANPDTSSVIIFMKSGSLVKLKCLLPGRKILTSRERAFNGRESKTASGREKVDTQFRQTPGGMWEHNRTCARLGAFVASNDLMACPDQHCRVPLPFEEEEVGGHGLGEMGRKRNG
jgi:hypothetical protein